MKALRFPGISLAVFVVVFLLSSSVLAQSSDPHITGIVTDSSKAIIRGAQVDLINVDTGVHYPTVTNSSGIYSITGKIGNYRIEVAHAGFKTIINPNIVLHTADALEINFEMAIGSASELVTVNGEATNDSPAVSMTVDREFVENVPLDGRSFQDLIQLAPGAVSSGGYYSINGQRTDSNNYTVDGVSANLGGFNDSPGSGGPGLAGAAPLQTVLGTTQSLASIDSLQEFTIQTSGYTAEYGRTPGGQIQFTTRSGTNQVHGSLFEYLRNTAFDANSYVNDYEGKPQTAEHQNDFGGTVGGPVIIPKFYNGKDKTFFFASYEGLRLLLPANETEYVPTQAFRNAASPNVQPFLNAAPLPNTSIAGDSCTVSGTTINVSGSAGPGATPCDEEFYYGYSYPDNLDNYSLRVDQNLGRRLHAFVRYADTPSSVITGAEAIETQATNAHTWTAGLTVNIASNLLDDFHFNYSHDGEQEIQGLRSIGGSVPWDLSLLIPAGYGNPNDYSSVFVEVPGTSLDATSEIRGSATVQHQYQIVDSIAWTREKHSLKLGGDWRRLTPTYTSEPYNSEVEIESFTAIQQGYATSVQVGAIAPGQPVFDNLSIYAQDHWKMSPRLSVDYGLRWEFNLPPGPSNGHYPVTLTSSNLGAAQLAPLGTQPWKTNYHSFAPRFGFAWNVLPSQNHALTVRGGFGIFFDTGQNVIGNAYESEYPFLVENPALKNVPLPLSNAVKAPPSLNFPLTPPYPDLYLADPNLTLPYTEQWNLSVDKMLNKKNTLTASYVGNLGRKLLFTQVYDKSPNINPDFTELRYTANGSQSNYNALQVQDIGRITNGLDLVASFTWAHALDNASNDDSSLVPLYGNSSYDLRRVLNLALNYQTPTASWSHWMKSMTHGWLLANRFSTQSGSPITNLYQDEFYLPDGTEAEYSPDLVPGTPIYLHGSAAGKVPGSWRLNRAAFACTTTGATSGACVGTPTRNGDLGRNYVRNPSFWALNTALQRSFPIYEQLHLNFRAEAFNIFNHPNLAGPNPTLSSSTFGQLTDGTTTIGSSNALYAMGTARSLQFSLHLQF